jgi:hypothetical protein
MNRQRNLILAAAVSAAFGVTAMSAHAGVASALPAKIATVALVSNSQGVKGNAVTYSTIVPLSNQTIYYVYVKLTNGVFATAPAAATVLSSSNNAALESALTSATAATLSTDGTFVVYTLAQTTATVTSQSTIIFTPTGTNGSQGGASGLTALLAGGSVNAVISIGSSAQTTTPLADIDSASGGNIITFTAPQSYTAISSGAAPASFTNLAVGGTGPETAVINVANGTGTTLASNAMVSGSTSLIDFGGFVVTDIPGVLDASQANSWSIANEYPASAHSLAATVTGNFAAASSLYLSINANCSTSINSLTLNSAKTMATLAGGTLTSGQGEVLCMQTNGTTTIPATTPAINISLTTGTGSVDTGAPENFGPSTLYSLGQNGGTVTIRAYIPAAASGYSDVVRIINIGQVASTVSVARIDPVTGVVGTAGVLPGTLAAGGATNYSAATIEAALGGALSATDRPRLLFTANTTIEGQNYIVNPNGTLTTLHYVDEKSQ